MRLLQLVKSVGMQIFYKVRYRGRIQFGTGHHLFGKQSKLLLNGREAQISLDGVRLNDYALLSASGEGTIKIGKNVTFNRCVNVVSRESVVIGDGCSFGPNVCIYDHDHYFDQDGFVKGKFRTAPIEIGEHVWVGANVVILRGSRIGAHSVIGAGVTIHGEIPPYSLVRNDGMVKIERLENR